MCEKRTMLETSNSGVVPSVSLNVFVFLGLSNVTWLQYMFVIIVRTKQLSEGGSLCTCLFNRGLVCLLCWAYMHRHFICLRGKQVSWTRKSDNAWLHLNLRALSLCLTLDGFPSFCWAIKLVMVTSLYRSQLTLVCRLHCSSSSVGYGDIW